MKRHLAVALGVQVALVQPAMAQDMPDRLLKVGAATIRTVYVRESSGRDLAAGDETLEVLFTDGTAITLAAGSNARIGAYAWQGGTGRLDFEIRSGLARVATGKLDSASGLNLTAGGAQVQLHAANALVDLRAGTPRVALLAGKGAGLVSAGAERNIERAGFAANGEGVRRLTQADMRDAMKALNPGLSESAGGNSVELAPSSEADARDLRHDLQLARLDLGPQPSRIGSGVLQPGYIGISDVDGQPVYTGDIPTINNSGLIRGPAAQAIAQDISASPARGTACLEAGASVACSQTVLNTFRTLDGSAGEVERAAGAAISIVLKNTGETAGSITQAGSYNGQVFLGERPDLNYAFGIDEENLADSTDYYAPMFVIYNRNGESIGKVIAEVRQDADGLDFNLFNSAQSKNASLQFFSSNGSFKFKTDFLADARGNRFFPMPADDGHVFSGTIVPYKEFDCLCGFPPEPFDTFQATPFGAARVSVLSSGFRAFRGITDQAATGGDTPGIFNHEFTLIDKLPDNFVALQIDEIANGPNPSDCAPGCGGFRYFFATGDIADAPADQGVSIDTFYLSPNVTDVDRPVGPGGSRAFFPDTTNGSIGTEDTLAYVVTKGDRTTAQFAHADFAYRLDGSRTTGFTLSAAIGKLVYTNRYDQDGQPTTALAGTVEPGRWQLASHLGRAIASTDGYGQNGALAWTDLSVRASGGGSPGLKQVDGADHVTSNTAIGRAGYLVLQSSPEGSDGSLVRIANGIASSGAADVDRTGGTFDGYLAGLVQMGTTREIAWLDVNDSTGLSLSTVDGGVSAALTLRAASGIPGATVMFGGSDNGAFISRDRFLALSPQGSPIDGAIVSSDFLGPFQGGADPLAAFDAAVPEYARWGAFLGDLAANAAQSQIASFAPWVAAPVTRADMLPTAGTATYSGAVLGNVAVQNGGATTTYLAGGNFTHDWSFANRRGNFGMTFDNRSYSALTGATPAGEFTGALRNSGTVSQVGAVTGSFASAPGTTAGSIPQATIGQFTINQANSYVAGGVFAGSKTK